MKINWRKTTGWEDGVGVGLRLGLRLGLGLGLRLGLGLGLGVGEVMGEEWVTELRPFPVVVGSEEEMVMVPPREFAERLAREVRLDLQTRGNARYQTDVVIRGGIFEGSGISVGGMTLFDPQTGHYFAEVPLDPGFFADVRLLTGVSNSLNGFNSTVGTVDWEWGEVLEGGQLTLLLGTDRHMGTVLRHGWRSAEGGEWEVSLSYERGDGSIAYADFEAKRLSGRYQRDLWGGQLLVFGGVTEKFYGWPGMYTGRPFLNETEDYRVGLLGWQYRLGQGQAGAWAAQAGEDYHRIGGYWREFEDDYAFARESPLRLFQHRTRVFSLQGDGRFSAAALQWDYKWTLLADRVVRSTSLVNGDFMDRHYGKAGILVSRQWHGARHDWTLYGGGTVESSNRDSTVGLLQAGVRMAGGFGDGGDWQVYAEVSQSSQVPGYTVLNSAPAGLFGGDATLGREFADNFEVGASAAQGIWQMQLVVFQREDRDLVDWVFGSDLPNARRAAAMDSRTRGVELWSGAAWAGTRIQFGYALLDKDPRYRSAGVDASFYALNFARHRIMANAQQQLTRYLQLRLDAEWRDNQPNSLRTVGAQVLLVHAALQLDTILPAQGVVVLQVNNLTDRRYQPVPGTPGPAREAVLSARFAW